MKKIYISADIEGICGVTDWGETELGSATHEEFRRQMTCEVAAACEGAIEAGVEEILVQDAHDSARNILAADLPPKVQLIRGWAGHPYCMLQSLDSSYDAVLFIGYHCAGGRVGNPLAHTMTNDKAYWLKLNGEFVSEFYLNSLIACRENVPVLFLSGDAEVCAEANQLSSSIATLASKEGMGASTINRHPSEICAETRRLVAEVLKRGAPGSLTMPQTFTLEICYSGHALAYRNSFYPGATLVDGNRLLFATQDYFEVLRFIHFVL
ncbi:M55 family metallopeptidase [Desulfotalea psychrophila]|uniref:D-aminopeptidase n=1 Tax=Desulfotalea psychrophila (strain LSv54 / DSM 12343) TaxID=177439 RepID=Q6APY1_DESPS|nr:M55 family metallopeptidase [Desulfotalea psychrophila]CAG35592.1 hypothetical protein DP0863 [Desulfotalea psychrophila LSv54]